MKKKGYRSEEVEEFGKILEEKYEKKAQEERENRENEYFEED